MSKSGIYRITFNNDTTGRCYIGSTVSLTKRKHNHLYYLRKNISQCVNLQRAWNKFGSSNFNFEVIAYVNVEALRVIEAWYMTQYQCAYNTAKQPGNVMGGRRHSKKTRLKMSKSQQKRLAA